MARLVGEHWEGPVRVRWYEDEVSKEITVERWQDGQKAVDLVAAVNAEGAPTIDGLGKPVAEIPVVVAMQFCERRGIPWEKFLYTREYDDDFKLLVSEYKKLAYQNAKSVHTVQ